jgi:hypothetical protein
VERQRSARRRRQILALDPARRGPRRQQRALIELRTGLGLRLRLRLCRRSGRYGAGRARRLIAAEYPELGRSRAAPQQRGANHKGARHPGTRQAVGSLENPSSPATAHGISLRYASLSNSRLRDLRSRRPFVRRKKSRCAGRYLESHPEKRTASILGLCAHIVDSGLPVELPSAEPEWRRRSFRIAASCSGSAASVSLSVSVNSRSPLGASASAPIPSKCFRRSGGRVRCSFREPGPGLAPSPPSEVGINYPTPRSLARPNAESAVEHRH